METHPWAWGFFVPFIIVATFTILNLFIGIIVSTMQELSVLPEQQQDPEVAELLGRLQKDLAALRAQFDRPTGSLPFDSHTYAWRCLRQTWLSP